VPRGWGNPEVPEVEDACRIKGNRRVSVFEYNDKKIMEEI